MSAGPSQPQDSEGPDHHARPPAGGKSASAGKKKRRGKNFPPDEAVSQRQKLSVHLAKLEAQRGVVAGLDVSTIERIAARVREKPDDYRTAIERLLAAETAKQGKLAEIESEMAEIQRRLKGPSLREALAAMPLYWVPKADAAKQRDGFALPKLPAEMEIRELLPFSALRERLRYTVKGETWKSEIRQLPDGSKLVRFVREWLVYQSKRTGGIKPAHSTPRGEAYVLTDEIHIPRLRQWIRLRCGVEGKGSSKEKAFEAYKAFEKRELQKSAGRRKFRFF